MSAGEKNDDSLPSLAASATRRHIEKTIVAVEHESIPPESGMKKPLMPDRRR
jgi:hypothetical protein